MMLHLYVPEKLEPVTRYFLLPPATLTEKPDDVRFGPGIEIYDAPSVRKIVHEAQTKDFRFSPVILGIVNGTP